MVIQGFRVVPTAVVAQVLLTRGATVVALEKDRRLIPVLQEKFKNFVESFIVHS